MLFYLSLTLTVALMIALLYLIGAQATETFSGSFPERESDEERRYASLQFGVDH